MDDARKAQAPIKGRGAASQVDGRYAVTVARGEDDGWGSVYEDLADAPRPQTQVTEERARSIISRNDSPDIGFGQSINPYRGCEHGCVYCFARPSHAYLDLSPGLDFETRLFAKTNAAERLQAELARPGYRCAPIALGINTDAYQPIERRYRITRSLIEVLAACRASVQPDHQERGRSTRDLDLLAPMARRGLVTVYFSVTTLDNHLAARMEPRASAPHSRLKAMRTLADAGVPVGRDGGAGHPDDQRRARSSTSSRPRTTHGARSAGYVLLRLPHELKQVWREWLQLHYPERAEHVMSLIQQMRGGKDYDSAFGTRMRGAGAVRAADRSSASPRRTSAWASGACRRWTRRCSSPPRKPSPQGELF